jgi:hypothetical protein
MTTKNSGRTHPTITKPITIKILTSQAPLAGRRSFLVSFQKLPITPEHKNQEKCRLAEIVFIYGIDSTDNERYTPNK